jgi:hypothetical protein
MSQDIGMTRTHVRVRVFCVGGMGGVFRMGAGRPAGGLVVAGAVEGELAEEFAAGGVDDGSLRLRARCPSTGPATVH